MKCHKCGFVSFDYLSECRKCGVNLEGSRSVLGLLDFKPSMPFFLGAMINAVPAGANGGSPGVASQTAEAMGIGGIDLGGDLEFEVDEDVQPTVAQRAKSSELDILPQIELPEGFSLSLGDEEKSDDLDLVMGSDFEQALSLGIDAKEFEDLGQPAPARDDLSELQFTEPILDFSSAVSNEDPAAAVTESAFPDLSLGLSLELESGGGMSGSGVSQEPGGSHGDEGMVIDFSQNDLENLLLELDDTPKGGKVGPSVTEQP
jgi:hypothetical protein